MEWVEPVLQFVVLSIVMVVMLAVIGPASRLMAVHVGVWVPRWLLIGRGRLWTVRPLLVALWHVRRLVRVISRARWLRRLWLRVRRGRSLWCSIVAEIVAIIPANSVRLGRICLTEHAVIRAEWVHWAQACWWRLVGRPSRWSRPSARVSTSRQNCNKSCNRELHADKNSYFW